MLSNDATATTFTITDTKLYVPIVTLSTLKIIQNYYNNWNQFLKEPLIGTNISQK